MKLAGGFIFMGKIKDISGQKFGRWTVLEISDKRTKQGSTFWKCICDCGNVRDVRSSGLLNGHSQSCGCLTVERRKERLFIDRTGETRIMSNGLSAEIIRYGNVRDIDVKFENGQIATAKQYSAFECGEIRCPMVIQEFGDYAKVVNPNTDNPTEFLVDIEDLPVLGEWFWAVDAKGYVTCGNIGKLHRRIMNAPNDKQVDHINGNKRDCRKKNLRLCTGLQNAKNHPVRKNNTSGFKGVSWHNGTGKWVARIGVDNKRVSLGYYETPCEAAKAYNEGALKYHGEFARLNKI